MDITLDVFNQLTPSSVFRTGVLPNSPEGIFMTRDGGELRWVAVKGGGEDWTIYCHWAHHSFDWIRYNGDKVNDKVYIQRCVPCADEVLDKYRF